MRIFSALQEESGSAAPSRFSQSRTGTRDASHPCRKQKQNTSSTIGWLAAMTDGGVKFMGGLPWKPAPALPGAFAALRKPSRRAARSVGSLLSLFTTCGSLHNQARVSRFRTDPDRRGRGAAGGKVTRNCVTRTACQEELQKQTRFVYGALSLLV